MSQIYRQLDSLAICRRPDRLASLLLPGCCVLCRMPLQSHQLCSTCWSGLALLTPPLCQICGRPQPYATPDGICSICSLRPPVFRTIRAVCRYNQISRQLLTGYKHAGKLDRTPLLGRLCLPLFDTIATTNMLVVPVPLHRIRYLMRGYNQSAELARWLTGHMSGSNTDIEFAPNLLMRRIHTPSMAGKNKQARARNVRRAFAVNTEFPDSWKDRPIMLIDDVMTTGATLQSCADTFISSGHKNTISALVFARVL